MMLARLYRRGQAGRSREAGWRQWLSPMLVPTHAATNPCPQTWKRSPPPEQARFRWPVRPAGREGRRVECAAGRDLSSPRSSGGHRLRKAPTARKWPHSLMKLWASDRAYFGRFWSTPRTKYPFATRQLTRWCPMKPSAPVVRTRMLDITRGPLSSEANIASNIGPSSNLLGYLLKREAWRCGLPRRPWRHGRHRPPASGSVNRSIRRSPSRRALRSAWYSISRCDRGGDGGGKQASRRSRNATSGAWGDPRESESSRVEPDPPTSRRGAPNPLQKLINSNYSPPPKSPWHGHERVDSRRGVNRAALPPCQQWWDTNPPGV